MKGMVLAGGGDSRRHPTTTNARSGPDISVVVPAFNEVGSVEELHRELCGVLADLGEVEILFVDDGSYDGTGECLDGIAEGDPQVRVLHFEGNRGKSAAYMAAFAAAKGRAILTLDADLQDDPNEIPRMLDELKSCDLIVGWKQGRLMNEPHKALPSKVFNRLSQILFGIYLHDGNCGFRAMKRDVAKHLKLHGDFYRFIPQLSHIAGFKVRELPVNHRKRRHGLSKYGPIRFWTGALDLLTVRFVSSFRDRPLHFFGTMAFLPLFSGGVLECYVLVMKLMGDTFREHSAAMLAGVMLILVGFQIFMTGLIGEMIAARAETTPARWPDRAPD
jgi:glycosyltransferase involved in cell wall biosynthesis